MAIINPSFEDGDTGWTKGPFWEIIGVGGTITRDGMWAGRWWGGNGDVTEIINDYRAPVASGQSITAQLYASTNGAKSSQGGVHIILVWYNSSNARIGETSGNIIRSGGTAMHLSTVTGSAPSGAAFVSVGARAYRNSNPRPYFIDAVSWSYIRDRAATLTSPTDGQEIAEGAVIPLRVEITGTQPAVTSVTYVLDGAPVHTTSSVPYGYNLAPQPVGTYEVEAIVNLADGTTITTNSAEFTVTATPVEPDTREFRASNSYTYLIGENFLGLSSSMPPNARVLGVEVLVDYNINILARTKDMDVTDPADANYQAVFDVISGGTVEAVLLSKSGTTYEQIGSSMTGDVAIIRQDFTIAEDGVSEDKRWTVLEGEDSSVTIGGENLMFGIDPEFGSIFKDYSIGIRFYPNTNSIPAYADSGDAAFRFMVQSFKVSIYFDAGSVEYYFASADKADIIKGTLVSYYVLNGDFRTGDASGVLQLKPELEIMDGSQGWIGNDWTIHAAYPPTDDNQIGEVGDIVDQDLLGMEYNGLPTQGQVKENRSRYLFITENFYGDPARNSMYGVHGLSRAFAYNGDYFYKIYTQADAEKDSPHHVANHHLHLALGFHGGRVDLSVVGEPYNYDGALGASSWAFGDKVVGLLPLSGTILGVFGSKSIYGIAGTTVDNFATQVISPNIGAIEYTICDMGFPVYANAYGVYTLNQTQQYGDYLGQPMSQAVSPWLRPRLLRRSTSDKEVVCAWPVRSKNQYRLAFSDGYVTSMTLNGSATPTFSFQKYFYTPSGEWAAPDSLYEYPSIVPAAVSSELDEAGEERIHIAPYVEGPRQ